MIEDFPIHLQVRAWLDSSVLRTHVSQYVLYLRERRYARQTVRDYLYDVAHFAFWASAQQLELQAINAEAVASFEQGHLPDCRCPSPVRRSPHEIRAALRRMLKTFRAIGILEPRSEDADPVAIEVSRFRHYMEDVRGLAKNICRQRSRIVSKFLTRMRAAGPLTIERLDAQALRKLVLNQQLRQRPGTTGVISGPPRCYIRFRVLQGDRISHLFNAVPRAANWRWQLCRKFSPRPRSHSC